VDGSNKREFCSEHKRDGMVDLIHKRCGHHGCSRQPSFGVDDSKKPEFCSEHKRDGMIAVRNESSSSGEGSGNGRGRGGASAAGGGGTVSNAGSGEKREDRFSPSPASSRRANKKARRVPVDVPVAPSPAEPIFTQKGAIPAENGIAPESADTGAVMKTEPDAFSLGRRGGWMR